VSANNLLRHRKEVKIFLFPDFFISKTAAYFLSFLFLAYNLKIVFIFLVNTYILFINLLLRKYVIPDAKGILAIE
jgi:hypothetical protein